MESFCLSSYGEPTSQVSPTGWFCQNSTYRNRPTGKCFVSLHMESLCHNTCEYCRARSTTYRWSRSSPPNLEVLFCWQPEAVVSLPHETPVGNCLLVSWDRYQFPPTGRFQAKLLTATTYVTKKIATTSLHVSPTTPVSRPPTTPLGSVLVSLEL